MTEQQRSLRQRILLAYETLAGEYHARIDEKPHNAYYDRPNTLRLLPDVSGMHVLDAACGPGKYAEILHERGATVTGFDLSPKMVEFARQRNGNRGTFYVQDLAEPFRHCDDAAYDLVLCALALHYVPEWGPTIREFHRVLKPGGTLVISVEHPFYEYTYFKSERYFHVEAVRATWSGFGEPVEVDSYRRPLQDCLQPLLHNGFYLDELLEPRPVPEFEERDPKHFRELNAFPAFMCLRAVKRG